MSLDVIASIGGCESNWQTSMALWITIVQSFRWLIDAHSLVGKSGGGSVLGMAWPIS